MTHLERTRLARPLSLALACLIGLAAGACGDDPSGGDLGQDVVDEADIGADVDNDVGDDTDTPDAQVDALPDADRDIAPDLANDPSFEANTDIPVTDGGDDDGPVEPDELVRVIAISPERGPDVGGTEILVIGLGFTFDTDVYLGGVLCESIDVVDETKIVCDTPPNPAGPYDVKVINTVGSDSLADGYTYFSPIEIDTVSPDRGPSAGGVPTEITGEGFAPDTQVSVGGRVALGIEVIDERTVRFLAPPGETGLATVRVAGENGLAELEDAFEYFDPVRVDAILPGAGPTAGGSTVVVEGVGFTDEDDMAVSFGLLEADFEVISGSEIIATSPAGPPDSAVDVTVQSVLNGGYTTRDGFYYYSDGSGLQLLHLAPIRGSSAGGDEVVLSGTGLAAVVEVTFDGIAATIIETDPSYLIVETPAHATGAVTVTVTGGGGDDASLVDAYTYVTALSITDIAPASGTADGGEAVTITGDGFADGATVRIGALPAAAVDVVDSGTITAVTPPGAVGAADVRVTVPSGLTATLEEGYTFTSEVLVLGFSPTKGAISGGAFVVVLGAGFIEPVVVTFDGIEAPVVTILDSSTIAVDTPPHGPGFVDVAVSVAGGEPVVALERFLYFDPTLSSGGHFGDPIDGAVNVTVISTQGAPLPESHVQLTAREDTEFTGITDANGQVTLSGPGIEGAQTVSATRIGFSSAVVDAVNVENVTVALSCVPENQCGSTDDCRDGFICTCGPPFGPIGICLEENFCGFEPQTQEEFDAVCVPQFAPLPFGLITGNLTGVEKVDDPGPNERVMGAVFTTQPHPFRASPVDEGTGNVRSNDGPYTLNSRTGEIAIIGVCGLFNDVTEVFTPRFMGVRRGLFIVDAETYEVDIDCNIRLDQTLTIKVASSPLAPAGPDRFLHIPYLNFGAEGYFGGIVTLSGTNDILSSSGFAALEGELAGLDYYIAGGAFTGDTFPETQAILEGVTAIDDIITLPEFVPPADMVQPVFGGMLVDRYLEWELATDVAPDFYSLLIYDFNSTIFWDVLVPGDETSVNLPFFPEDASVGTFPPGTLILQILAVDALTFDYDNFDNFNNFVLSNWRSWSTNLFLFNNPG